MFFQSGSLLCAIFIAFRLKFISKLKIDRIFLVSSTSRETKRDNAFNYWPASVWFLKSRNSFRKHLLNARPIFIETKEVWAWPKVKGLRRKFYWLKFGLICFYKKKRLRYIIIMPPTSCDSNNHRNHRSAGGTNRHCVGRRRHRNESEISCVVKYMVFGFNVIFWV